MFPGSNYLDQLSLTFNQRGKPGKQLLHHARMFNVLFHVDRGVILRLR